MILKILGAFNIYTPELSTQSTSSEAAEIYLAKEVVPIGEVLLVNVVIVECTDPNWEIVVTIFR